jgi:replicative DNA helicase
MMKQLPATKQLAVSTDVVLPHSKDAEQGILGCILVEPSLFLKAKIYLHPKMFYYDTHRIIYQVMDDLTLEQRDVNIVSLSERLKESKQLHNVGGAPYIALLLNSVQSTVQFSSFSRIILEKWKQRTIWKFAVQLQQKCTDNTFSEIGVEEIKNKIDKVFMARGSQSSYKFGVGLETIFADIENSKRLFVHGVPHTTTLPDLDQRTGGLEKKTLTVVGAKSSIGKTSLLTQMAYGLARAGNVVLFFTSEMPESEIRNRVLCSELGIGYFKTIRKGDIDELTRNRIQAFIGDTKTVPLLIYFTPALTLEQVENEIDKQKPDFVFIDFIQQMKLPGRSRPDFELSQLCAKMKKVAGQANCGIIVASQFSRAMDKNDRSKPKLSDLKESGGIEISGDLVLLLHRGSQNADHGDPEHQRVLSYNTDIWIAKQRNGPADVRIKTLFLTRPMRFVQLSEEPE